MRCSSATLTPEHPNAFSKRPPHRHCCTSPSSEATSWASVREAILSLLRSRNQVLLCLSGMGGQIWQHAQGIRPWYWRRWRRRDERDHTTKETSSHWGQFMYFYGVYSSSVCYTCPSVGFGLWSKNWNVSNWCYAFVSLDATSTF